MDDSQTDTLRGIKLTKEGKKAIKEIDYVKDSKRADILQEYGRDAILAILRKGIPDTMTTKEIDEKTGKVKVEVKTHLTRHALSIVELAKLSNDSTYVKKPITKSQVIHHLPIMIENGYVIKYGTLKTGKRSTDYYRRTSEIFLFFDMPGMGDEELKEFFNNEFDRIEEVYGLPITKSDRKELLPLYYKEYSIEQEAREHLVKRARTDIARGSDIDLHHRLCELYSFKFEEWIEVRKRIREIIFSK
jgi:hypothetical protein